MKKLNMKSILALLLTLCMLLGSVAALAEGEAAAPAADAAAAATEPTPAAPIGNTEVTFAADPTTANTVDVTVTDASTDSANQGISVERYGYNYVEDPETGADKATDDAYAMSVHGSTAMIDLDERKLLQGNDNMNLTFGGDTVNLTKPTEQTHPEWNYETDEPMVDENGKEIIVTEKNNDATALSVWASGEVTTEGTLTVTGGDVYAGTSAKIDNYDDLNATAVGVNGDSEKTSLDVNLNSAFAKADAPATVPAEGQKADDVKNTLSANASGVQVSTADGGKADVELKEGATAIANAKNGNASATAAALRDYGDGKKESKATLTMGDATAKATSETGDAGATALLVDADGSKQTMTATAGNLTATATGAVEASATGLGGYFDPNAISNVKTGSITATATVTGEETEKQNTYATATGARAFGDNGTYTLEINGDVTATSSKDAYGIQTGAYTPRVWDEKAEKSTPSETASVANVKVTGNIIAEGGAKPESGKYGYIGNQVIGINTFTETYSTTKTDENDKTKKTVEYDKVGGEATITVTGNVLAKGSETAGEKDETYGISVAADTNAKNTVTVTGDVTATGKGAAGINVEAMKGSTVNVLVDGTVSGDNVAITAMKSYNSKNINLKGEDLNKDEPKPEYDPNAAGIYVWAAKENADGRIATVYDEVYTSTAKEVKKTAEDGTEYTDTEYDYAVTRTVDAEASAKLEAAIWYIAKVADKWQDKITVTGTGTYTAGDTTYQVAHQNDDVKLSFKVPHGKKLKAIMYDDGTKAEYVKNEDGTYTIKMQRGGGMLLSLKFKKKAQQKAAAAAASTEGEAESTNWAYGVEIENVGTVYYGRDYFAQKDKDIINPLTKEAYTKDEIKAIVDGAKKGAEGYKFDIPEEAWLGMNDFWYDKDAALAIVGHEDELTIGDDGVFTTADGEEVAKPIKK